jgi:hypothetical protein
MKVMKTIQMWLITVKLYCLMNSMRRYKKVGIRALTHKWNALTIGIR